MKARLIDSYNVVAKCHQLEPDRVVRKFCPSAAALLRRAAKACRASTHRRTGGRAYVKADRLQRAGVQALRRCMYDHKSRRR